MRVKANIPLEIQIDPMQLLEEIEIALIRGRNGEVNQFSYTIRKTTLDGKETLYHHCSPLVVNCFQCIKYLKENLKNALIESDSSNKDQNNNNHVPVLTWNRP